MTHKVQCVFLILFAFLTNSVFLYAQESLPLSSEDRLLLKKIQKDTFQYFLIHTDPETGLTKDSSRSGAPASIAATGFA